MFEKMLTHMHMVVYTWWCWHIFKGGGVPRVERSVGGKFVRKWLFASSAGFGAFEKIKSIFSIAPVENLEKSRKCFSLRNTHRTLELVAPDAGPERPVWCLWRRCAPDAPE